MKLFRIAVNGTSYDVEVTELDGAAAGVATPVTAPIAAATPTAVAATPSAPVSKAAPAGSGESITAPMNGTIARVTCRVGDAVAADTVVIILEAMKMESEIFAGVEGVVKSIQVNAGDVVQPGDVLVVIG